MLSTGALSFIRSTRPKIIARNWDRFGGRAHEIVNGVLLAERLQMDFFFVWPYDREVPEMQEQISFFATDFVRNHLISYVEMEAVKRLAAPKIKEMTLAEANKFVSKMWATEFFVPPNFTKVPCFSDDDPEKVLQDFARIAASITHPANLARRREITSEISDSTVIHARYGDLINGNWKQYVDPKKYISTMDLSSRIAREIECAKRVFVVSDTPEIVNALSEIHSVDLALPHALSSKERFAIQCDELFALAEASKTLGPQGSLFSLFAVHMGSRELEDVGNLPVNQLKEQLGDDEFLHNHYSHFPSKIRGQIKSRDICIFLNEYAFTLSPTMFKNFALMAAREDSKYVMALSMSAVALALSKDWDEADRHLARAMRHAKRAQRIHSDPLFVVIAVQIAVTLLQHLLTQDSESNPSQKTQVIRRMRELLETIKEVKPTQVETESVVNACSEVVDTLDSLTWIELSEFTQGFLDEFQGFANNAKKRDFTSNLLVGLTKALSIRSI